MLLKAATNITRHGQRRNQLQARRGGERRRNTLKRSVSTTLSSLVVQSVKILPVLRRRRRKGSLRKNARRTLPGNLQNRLMHRASRRGRRLRLQSGLRDRKPLRDHSKATTPQVRPLLRRTAARRLPSTKHGLNSSLTEFLLRVEVAHGLEGPRAAMQLLRRRRQPPKRLQGKLRTLLRADHVKERIKRRTRTRLQAAQLEPEV